jgi:LacI family transcriptional regulator
MPAKKGQRATIVDISRIANVSMSTVSHVINGTRNVNDETKNKVLAAIEQTGYTPNQVAKSLKNARTKTIGLVVSDLRNPFFIEVVSGIEYESDRNGYTLLLSDSNDDASREYALIKNLFDRRIDGLILSPTSPSNEKTYQYLKTIGLSTVLIDRTMDIDYDWVGIENNNSTKILVNHLIGLGHRHIALVAGLRGINTTEERMTGFKAALSEANIPFSESDIIVGESRSLPAEKNVTDYFMNTKPLPTALVVANNLMVLGTMRALQKMNIVVPQDLAVVSFDDFEWADLFQPRLTTISQPCFQIGVNSVRLLLNRIENPGSPIKKLCLEPTLMVRESCGSGLPPERLSFEIK